VSADTEQTNDPEGPLASDNPTSGEGSEFRRRGEAYRVSADTEALLATVRPWVARGAKVTLDFDDGRTITQEEALAALDSLAAELERLRISEQMQPIRAGWKNRAEVAEAELERVKAALLKCDEGFKRERAEVERVKAEGDGFRDEAAEQQMRWLDEHGRLDKALAALREIEQIGCALPERKRPVQHKIARHCLAEIEGEEAT